MGRRAATANGTGDHETTAEGGSGGREVGLAKG
jgi:hypothetical protein